MKKLPNNHWTINEDTEGLLFFAQRLSEMLFDFTIDTYKAPALNALLLCIEARQTIDYIENQSIDAKHLEYVIEELNWSCASDLVVKYILGEKKDLFLPLTNITDTDEIKIELELLLNLLSPQKYIDTIKKLLSIAVKGNQKKDINFLTSNFVTTLTTFAYHQNYLYQKTISFFFDETKVIDNENKIDEFLSLFELKEKKYNITFVASSIFKEIKETCEKFNVTITETLDSNVKKNPEWKSYRNSFKKRFPKDCFVTVKEEEAFDEYSARKDAGQRLRKIANLFTYFHHKKRPSWEERALVSDTDNSDLFLISTPTSPMKKGFDLKPRKAAIKLNKFIDQFISNFGSNKKSFVLFNRANDLHGLAVADSSIENQLLNVWIAIETIIQSNRKKSKIEHITESLLPSLTLNYCEKLIKDLAESLARWNLNKFRQVIKKIPDDVGRTVILKTTALITCEEFKDLRMELYRELVDFPLLKFRICQLHEQLKSPEKILKLIENHKKKVRWHIKRIYRTRNLIVHEGAVSTSIEILVENAHTYLDSFLNKLIDLAEEGTIKSIEQGIRETSLLFTNYEKELENNRTQICKKEDFQKYIFNR